MWGQTNEGKAPEKSKKKNKVKESYVSRFKIKNGKRGGRIRTEGRGKRRRTSKCRKNAWKVRKMRENKDKREECEQRENEKCAKGRTNQKWRRKRGRTNKRKIKRLKSKIHTKTKRKNEGNRNKERRKMYKDEAE